MSVNVPRIGQLLSAVAFALAMFGPASDCGLASGHAPAGGHEADAHEEVIDDGDDTHAHGIELGEFEVRTSRTVPPQKNRIRFKIYATAAGERYRTLRELTKNRANKVRDQVIVATRLVPIEAYDDPELMGLRRRILMRLRRTLPELPIDDIFVSDFSISSEST